MTTKPTLPFDGVRVLELGTVIAGPFAGSLMGDLGAEVIKIEPPGAPDALRKMGRMKEGVPLWWGVAARDKRCVTLNLKSAPGKTLFERLVRESDVVIENYRPGVLDRLGLGWESLHALNGRLILLSISGFGQTGPYGARPGFGKVAEGFSGAVSLTGSPSEQPLFVGFSLADACTGLFGALGIALALYHRDIQGGGGSHIDLALYEPLMRMLDAQFGDHDLARAPAIRQGTSDPYGWGHATESGAQFHGVRSKDGAWLLVRLPDAETARRLTGAAGRSRNAVASDLAAFAAARDADTFARAVLQAGAAVVPVFDGASAAANAYFRSRGDAEPINDPVAGSLSVPAPIEPRFGGDPRRGFHAPGVGEHTQEVLADVLGLKPAEIAALRAEGVL